MCLSFHSVSIFPLFLIQGTEEEEEYLNENDIGTSFGQGNGHLGTDTASAAGHQSGAVFKGEEGWD